MKLTKFHNSNFNLSRHWVNYCLLLLLVGGVKISAQIFVSENTVFKIKENTTLHISEITDKQTEREKVKIYISQNTKITNLPSDSLVEIVYLKNKTFPKAKKKKIRKVNTKPLQPIYKEDTPPENSAGVLSLISKSNSPINFLYSVYATKAGLANNTTSTSFKLKPFNKLNLKIAHLYFLNIDTQKCRVSLLIQTYPQKQTFLEEPITRPPPFFV